MHRDGGNMLYNIVDPCFFIFLLILRKHFMNDTQNIQLYVGENIRKIRMARGLSLEELAARSEEV